MVRIVPIAMNWRKMTFSSFNFSRHHLVSDNNKTVCIYDLLKLQKECETITRGERFLRFICT